jgi:hypothetical protein
MKLGSTLEIGIEEFNGDIVLQEDIKSLPNFSHAVLTQKCFQFIPSLRGIVPKLDLLAFQTSRQYYANSASVYHNW